MKKNTHRTSVFAEALANLQLFLRFWLRPGKGDDFIDRQNITAVL